MVDDVAARELLGKTIVVGITHTTDSDEVIRREQYSGRIVRFDANEGLVIQTPSGEERALPLDLRALFGARRGEYRFRSTGEVVANPDLETSWTRKESRES